MVYYKVLWDTFFLSYKYALH